MQDNVTDATPQRFRFRLRGESMDRLETFVAAAFAFAVTMLVISIDDVPKTFDEFVMAVKLVPSFAASFAIVAWIWATHANWCRRYGLEDGPSIVMSCVLVFLVLVYVFPLRLMMQGLFAVLSDGFLPSEMRYSSVDEVRFMFIFYACGFWALSANFFVLFHYALKKREQIGLSEQEVFQTETDKQSWALTNVVPLVSMLIALYAQDQNIGWSGFAYFLLFPVLTSHAVLRNRKFARLTSQP
ncbi:TMEM175 family protein [Aestuariibacter salexigens]|uniref:TMEM175 family protein n=1 Tax=Aestuariibacter salexigens TaxID=226010 RepID=UPI0004266E0C|nr:TMEM175 family protein [Aestuariibacter salexigens]